MKNILLIEDVPEMRLFLELCLKDLALGQSKVGSVSAVSSVREARVLVFKNRPDIVFLDEVLPGESLEANTEYFFSEKIPVILMSSLETPRQLNETQRSFGVVGKFKKTADFDLKLAQKCILDVLKSVEF